MRIAIVYNRDSKRVINLFGLPNREKYGLKNINRIVEALESGGHRVRAFEGDKDLIDRLEEFMPRVVKHERPGLVFNLSYGIQGQARYTHVPGMLEMIGLPYVGSGPLAHSLCLDKVVSKMIFVQHGLPTPEFDVLTTPDFEMPKELAFPLIVKPKNEAVSFGIQICNSEPELRAASKAIFDKFDQPVLVERFISGREINVGLLGNNPPEALPPAEMVFGEGPQIYTYEDKTRRSGREVGVECPAKLSDELSQRAQDIAKKAFTVLGCYDCARVDMRLDDQDNLYILEVNSLPSLGAHGSYVEGAAHAGLDFPALCNRLVEVASARYFGTPHPPELNRTKTTNSEKLFEFITQRRDEIESQVEKWTRRRSRTSDPIGMQSAFEEVDTQLKAIGMSRNEEFIDERVAWTWETTPGFEQGTLLVAHVDVPMDPNMATQSFRRDPEWIFGEGIGSSRAPLVSAIFALRALRHIRILRKVPAGLLLYSDEGRDCRYSRKLIERATARARNVLVLRPGQAEDSVVTSRRGQRRYQVDVEGTPVRLGEASSQVPVLRWLFPRFEECAQLTSRRNRLAVSVINLHTQNLPMLQPHHAQATLLLTYPNDASADEAEQKVREILKGKRVRCEIKLVSDRPPMTDRPDNARLAQELAEIARHWEIGFSRDESVWPSVAGLAAEPTGVVCGMGPVTRELYTPQESVERTSLVQRTLMLAEFLRKQARTSKDSS